MGRAPSSGFAREPSTGGIGQSCDAPRKPAGRQRYCKICATINRALAHDMALTRYNWNRGIR